MIEILGTLVGLAKEAVGYLTWDEDTKVVDGGWLDKSGLRLKLEKEGYKLYWSSPEKIESRKLDGYELIYEVDKVRRVRNKIVWSNGHASLTLMGMKD